MGWRGTPLPLPLFHCLPCAGGSRGRGCTRAHRGRFAVPSAPRRPEVSRLKRRLRVLPARRGANPRLRGRRPRPSAGPLRPRGGEEWLGASCRSAALRSGRALCNWPRTGAPAAALGGGGSAGAGAAGRAAAASSIRRVAAWEPRSLTEGQSRSAPERVDDEEAGVGAGEVARALSSFPCPARSVLCARDPRGPDATCGSAGQRGLRSPLPGPGGGAASAAPRPRRSRRCGRDPQLLRGGGRVEGAKLSCSQFAPSPLYSVGKVESRSSGVHLHPPSPGAQLFPGPLVL